MASVKIKRIYAPTEDTDGKRILIDRLWPRGVTKEAAQLDRWMKEIAPSVELRKAFNHRPEKFEEFKVSYLLELKNNAAASELMGIIKTNSQVTLLYGAHDEQNNHAAVLLQFINSLPK
jgi:uncharacterized protein YeaO (DUF488 family)